MDVLLQQLSGLFLRAIPTVVFFLLLCMAYWLVVHRPLTAVLAQRHALTEGAMEKARADIADAEARTQEYEQRLRDAKMSLYKAQEARRRQLLDWKATALAEARTAAESHVQAARDSLRQDVERAKASLQAEAESLAAEIIRTVLRPARSAQAPVGGGVP